MSDLDITGRVSMDASQAERALENLSAQAGKMSVDMAKAGDATRKAVEKIGDISTANGEKFTKSEGTIVNSIKRLAAEAAKAQPVLDKLGNIEFNIAAKGLDSAKFAPYLDVIKSVSKEAQESAVAIASASSKAGTAASASLNKIGVSAAQTANALRGVPAQFTDIVTSLQGGQAPLTVFLQQGGQLKDMFGGAGNAARALGGYVAGLVSPFTILAAAVGGVALAYFQGSKEADAYNKALILSGNAAGTTASQMQQMAQRISSVVGTQGAAAATLAQLAGSSRIAAENFEYFGTVALKVEKTVGTSVAETVKQFAELGKAPVEASKELNDETNYLTQSIYEQIKALKDQGREADAAATAQKAYADALSSRSDQMTQNLGLIERAWRGITGAAKGAWDAMLNVGRSDSMGDQLAAARAALEQKLNTPLAVDNPAMQASREKGIAALRNQIALLTEQERLLKRGAESQAARAQAEKAAIEATDALGKANEKALTKQEQMNKALGEYRANLEKVKAVNPNSVLLDAATISKAEAAIREQFKEKAASRAKAPAIKADTYDTAAVKAYLDVIKDLSKIENDAIGKAEELSKAQNRLREAMASPEFAAFNRRKQEEIILAGAAAIAAEDAAAATKILADERAKELDSYVKSAKSANDKAQALEDEVAMYGKTKSAIAELTVARLKEEKAKQMSYGDDKAVQALDDEIAALRRVAVARDALDGKEASTKAAEETTKAWKKTADDIERALTDSLMRGFESGKSVFTSLRDYIVNAFKTMVVKIAVQPIVGALTGVSGGIANAATGAGGAGSILGSASNFISGASAIGGMFGTSAAYGAALGTTSIAAGSQAAMLAAQTGSFGAAGLSATASAAGGAAGAATGAASSLSGFAAAAGPWIAGAVAIAALADAMKYTVDDKGGAFVAQASGAGTSSVALRRDFQQNGGLFGGGTTQNSEWRDADASIRGYFDTSIMATTASVKKYADALGLAPNLVDDFKKQIEVSITGLDAAGQQAAINKAIGGFVDEMVTASYGGVLSGVAKAGETSGQTLERLALSLGTVNSAFSAMSEALLPVSVAGASAAAELADAFGGLDKLQAGLGAYYQAFYSDAEKAASATAALGKEFDRIGVSVPTSKEAFRELVSGIDRTTSGGRSLYASVINLAPAFDQISQSATQALDEIARSIADLENVGKRLQVELLAAQGDKGGASALQRALDTVGFTDAETALYDYNAAIRAQIATLGEVAKAQADMDKARADAAAQLATTNKGLKDQLDILTGAQTQRSISLRDAGDESTAALLRQIFAQEDMAAASKAAGEAAKAASESFAQAAADMLDAARGNTDSALAGVQRAVQAQKDSIAGQISNAKTIADSVRGVFTVLRDNIESLYASVDSTSASGAASGRDFIANALRTANVTGYLPEQEALQDAIGKVSSNIKATQFASKFEQDKATLVLAGQLSSLKKVAEPQLTAAEQAVKIAEDQLKALDLQLETAQEQVDSLRGIDASVKSVADAIAGLSGSISAERAAAASSASASAAVPAPAQSLSATLLQSLANGSGAITKANVVDSVIADAAQSGEALNMALYRAAIGAGITAARLDTIMDFEPGSANKWARENGVPQFAQGTNYTQEGLAYLHEGEAVVPRAYNPAAGGGGGRLEALVEGLTKEVQRLQAIVATGNDNTRQLADQFDNVTEGGNATRTVAV